MNIVQFLASFFYRIRYWLLWGSLLVTALVIYFTQFLPYSYTVNSSLYAGVTNSTNLDGSQLININSTFDNIINIGKSKNTLAKVSVSTDCQHYPTIRFYQSQTVPSNQKKYILWAALSSPWNLRSHNYV